MQFRELLRVRTNRLADSRESFDSREWFQRFRIEPFFCESRFRGLKVANRRFEAIRANDSDVRKIVSFSATRFLRIAGTSKCNTIAAIPRIARYFSSEVSNCPEWGSRHFLEGVLSSTFSSGVAQGLFQGRPLELLL